MPAQRRRKLSDKPSRSAYALRQWKLEKAKDTIQTLMERNEKLQHTVQRLRFMALTVVADFNAMGMGAAFAQSLGDLDNYLKSLIHIQPPIGESVKGKEKAEVCHHGSLIPPHLRTSCGKCRAEYRRNHFGYCEHNKSPMAYCKECDEAPEGT